jgi:hypothetical protein
MEAQFINFFGFLKSFIFLSLLNFHVDSLKQNL